MENTCQELRQIQKCNIELSVAQGRKFPPIECLHYALNLPTSVVITGIDSMEILEQAFEAVRTLQPMNDEQVRRQSPS